MPSGPHMLYITHNVYLSYFRGCEHRYGSSQSFFFFPSLLFSDYNIWKTFSGSSTPNQLFFNRKYEGCTKHGKYVLLMLPEICLNEMHGQILYVIGTMMSWVDWERGKVGGMAALLRKHIAVLERRFN